MSKLPPIPPEQRAFGKRATAAGSHADPEDFKDAGALHTREQGRMANLSQSVKATHFKHQDR